MKNLFFVLITLVTVKTFALLDNSNSKSTPNDYKVSDPNLTSLIFNEIKTHAENPGDINFLYEQYQLASRQLWKQSKSQSEFDLIYEKLNADYLNEAYIRTPNADNKKDLDDQLAIIKKSGSIYVPRTIGDQFATVIDVEKQTYIYAGVTYDVNDNVVTVTPVIAKKKSSDVTPVVKPSQPKPLVSCVWDSQNPRKLVSGPSCNADGSCICRGYVICDRSGIQKRRLATCSEHLCTDTTASECSAEKGYGSQIPQD